MSVRVSTGGLQELSEEQKERIHNNLLQSVVRELGHALPPDWTQITFSRVGPSHEVFSSETAPK